MKPGKDHSLDEKYLLMNDAQWAQVPTTQLTDFIVRHFHNQHRQSLRVFIWKAEQLSQKGRETHELQQLSIRLKRLNDDLLPHMEKEEQILFPFMADHNTGYLHIEYCIAHHHHDDHLLQLDTIEQQLNALVDTNFDELKALIAAIRHFIRELRLHIDIENRFLFVD